MVKRSIFRKMFITMVGLIISLLMMLTYIQIEFQRAMFENELEKRIVLMKGRLIDEGHNLSENLAEQVKNAVASSNFSLVANRLTLPVMENKKLYYIILMQANGRIYLKTLKPPLEMHMLSKKEDKFALHQKDIAVNEYTHSGYSFMEFIRPLKVTSKNWGVLRLGFSLEVLNQEIRNSRAESEHQIQEMIKRLLKITSVFIIMGAFVVLLVSERLSKPLMRLIGLANALADGDFSVSNRVKKINPEGEIGALTASFVQMANKLKISYERLEDNNRTLEQRVIDRTIELAEARDEAIAANKSKSDFLSVISHEIRTPMNAIIGMTRLVLQTELTAKQQDFLTKVQISSRILLGIINDILDFSKIEAGKLELEKIVFNLEDVLNDLTSLMAEKILEKGLQLNIMIAEDVPLHLIGDPLRLGQILLNLISNALKFTSEGDIVIKIGLAKPADLESDQVVLLFSVTDTGIGLTKEQIGGLFQSFSQADKSTTRKYGGTGLGLAICKRMVGMMKGEIYVESEIEKGSTFLFTAYFELAPKPSQQRVLSRDVFRHVKALVVDSNETSRDAISLYLETFLIKVTQASSAEQAISQLKNASTGNPFQLVIMDVNLPGMDGIRVAEQIKLNTTLNPCIILVAQQGDNRIQQANVDGILIKPVQPSVLFNAIVDAFDHSAVGESILQSPRLESKINEKLQHIKGTKLLLVEDNHINRLVAKETLEQEGFEVFIAVNGQDALKKIHATYFDAVLMDLQMPVMDGYEAARLIRSESRFDYLPIIAMTAHAMDDVKERCMSIGMNGYITKPIDVDELLTHLVDVLDPNLRKSKSFPLESLHQSSLASLPEILPGIDRQQILKNVVGNVSLLCQMLVKFQESFSDTQTQLDRLLRVNDVDSALALLHTLKGVAANLAMFELRESIDALEQILKKPWHYEPELLTDFGRSQNKVLDTVRLICNYNSLDSFNEITATAPT